MRRITILISALFLTAIASDTFAQQSTNWRAQIGYNVSAPLGSFKNDFIKNTSFRGVVGEVSYAFNPKFSLGLQSGFQNYYQKYGRQVYQTQPNEHISAVVTNTIEIVPILVKGTFSPMAAGSIINPYVSLGAGLNMVSYSQYLGEFPGTDASGHFAAQVGAGVMVPFSKARPETAIKVGASYSYGAYNKNYISNLNSVAGNIGVVFALK